MLYLKCVRMFVNKSDDGNMNFVFQIASDPERLTIYLAALFQCVAFAYSGTKLLAHEAKRIIEKWKQKNNISSKSSDSKDTIINNYYFIVNNPSDILSVDRIENINYNFFNVNDINQIQSAYVNINESIVRSD